MLSGYSLQSTPPTKQRLLFRGNALRVSNYTLDQYSKPALAPTRASLPPCITLGGGFFPDSTNLSIGGIPYLPYMYVYIHHYSNTPEIGDGDELKLVLDTPQADGKKTTPCPPLTPTDPPEGAGGGINLYPPER